MKHIVIGALALFITSPFSAIAQKQSVIRLAEINGRAWLVTPEGKPFFAHGITHLSNQRAKIDLASISKACKEMGFNAYGYGCPEQLRSDMPYVESWNHLVPISYYRGQNGVRFVDVFDPKVQARLDAGVKANCFRSQKNPNAIGYCWTDLGSWPLKNPSGRNWVDFMRNLPEEAPGRKAYQEFLSEWKGDNAMARDKAFLRLIAREYFRVIGGAQRKYDPDHLVFGDRFAFNTLVPEVLEEMLPYVDGIAIQPSFWGPFPKKKFDEIHELTGKPIILCDFAIRFKDGDKDVRMWKLEDDSVAAGKAYSDYVKAALKTDYVVGVFWCNPVDTPKGFGKSGVKQGFFGNGLTPRPGLSEAVIALNRHIAQITPGNSGATKANEAPKELPHPSPTKKSAPGIVDDMFASLKLTTEQQAKFEEQEKDHRAARARFRELKGEELRRAQNAFYGERKKRLRKIFTEEQWAIWSKFWKRAQNR